MLEHLHRELRALERQTSPFVGELPARDTKDVHWVTPKLVGEVSFSEWTLNWPNEPRLRHPSWRGLRPDKNPSDLKT